MTKHHFALLPLILSLSTACSSMSIPNDTISLAGEWQLYEANQTTITHPQARLKFDEQQQHFHAYAGCNQLFGRYQRQGHTLKIDTVASTLMMCEPSMMTNDKQVTSALEKSVQYRIQGQQLELQDKQGKTVLKARR